MRVTTSGSATGLAVIVASTCFVTGRSARADLATDATDIIEQLIEDDIARNVVPKVACDLPLAENFFPGTVGAIESERFGGLPVILRKEVSDLLGLAVLHAIDPSMFPGPVPAGVAPAATLASPEPAAASAAGTAPKAKAVVAPTDRQVGAFSNLVRRRGQKPKKLKATPESPLTSSGTATGTTGAGATAASSLPTGALPSSASTPVPATSAASCPFFQNGNPVDPGLISKATQQMTACLTPQADIEAELGCSAALAVRDAADGDDQLLPNDAQRLAAAAILDALSQAKPGLGSGKAWVEAATKLAEDIAQHKSVADDAKDFCSTVSSSPPTTCVADATAVLQTVRSFLTAGVNASNLDQALAIVGQIVSDGCTGSPPPFGPAFCSSNAKQFVLDAANDAVVTIGDVRTKDYGAAASEAIGAAQQLDCDADPESNACTPEAKKVFAFLEALAAYSVDSLVSGTASAQTDTTFRQAAVALIEEEGGAGVRRSLWKNAAWAYVPEFSLREAWRPGHIGTSGSQVLGYPSVEMVRFRASPYGTIGSRGLFYLNLHGSLIDPLGPFVEVGTRDSSLGAGGSLSTGVFFLGFVVPRLDLEFGMPQLTKNLVIGVGGSARAFRAEGTPGAAQYCTVFDSTTCPTNKVLTGGNFEGSVFVKFVP